MFLTRPSVSRLSVDQSCFSCQRYSSETAQQNFVKLCSNEEHNVKMCLERGLCELALSFFHDPCTESFCYALLISLNN